jgi:peptide/nickel transport system permease protein
MGRFIVQRLLQAAVLVVLVATVVFFLGRLTGNPADLLLPEDASEADRISMIKTLGLDRPLHEQYVAFATDALRGDLGTSIRYQETVVSSFMSRLPNTIMLATPSMIIAVLLAVPLGVFSALRRGQVLDRVAGTIAVLGIATPNFWLGIMLIFLFSVELGWLPSGRMGGPEHYVLPAVTLGTFLVAGFMRLIRSSMLEILDSEFVKMARIKGLSEMRVIWKHCLRNALIPVLTLWGVFMGGLVTGAIVTETVFAWPGIGRLTYEAVIYRDFPLLQGVIILAAVLIVFINLLVDILYAYVDPRIRFG